MWEQTYLFVILPVYGCEAVGRRAYLFSGLTYTKHKFAWHEVELSHNEVVCLRNKVYHAEKRKHFTLSGANLANFSSFCLRDFMHAILRTHPLLM